MGKGANRTIADDLYIEGEPNYAIAAAIAGVIYLDDREDLEKVGRSIPAHLVHETREKHADAIREAAHFIASRKLTGIVTPKLAGFCYYRFSQFDRDAAIKFIEDLRTGANLTEGDPVLRLRNRLVQNATSKAKLPPLDILALMIKAWNYRREGRVLAPTSNMGWRANGGEPFPVIL